MLSLWANFSLFLGAAVLFCTAWFVLFVVGKIIFEDFLGGAASKIKKRFEKKDHYVY